MYAEGPPDALKESWKAPSPSATTSALVYLTNLYQRMADANDIAMYNEREVKATMAQPYELKDKSKEFSIGELAA